MSRRLVIISSVLLIVAASSMGVMAQGGAQNRGSNGLHTGQENIVTLEGNVVSIQMAPGQGTPSFTLLTGGKEVSVVLGPYRMLADKKLDIVAGSRVSVQAIQSLRLENAFAAIQIANLDTGSTLVLRDANGMPNWAGGKFGRNGGFGCDGTGQPQLDLSAKAVLEGTVESVNMGLGQGFPNFTLSLADGKTATIISGPFRLLWDAGFKIAIGDQMSVTAYPSLLHEGMYIAAELNNRSTAASLTLRDAQGMPLAGTHAGPGGAGRGGCLRSF